MSQNEPNYASLEFTSEPLRLRIAAVLRNAILDGDLRPGEPLIETALSEKLGVSRAPIREAMRILANEGLIETEPYKGSRVRTITRDDVEEVYSLRRLHEGFAIEQILKYRDQRDLHKLRGTCERMLAHAARGDMRGVSAEDDLFHSTLIELADHRLLLEIWLQLSLRARQIMSLRNLQLEDPERVAANHMAIVEALEAERLGQALELLGAHIEEGAQLAIDGWGEE